MKLSRSLAAAGSVVIAVSLALTGCGSTDTESTVTDGGTLTLASVSAPTTFAANALQFGATVWYAQAAYDTLLRLDPETMTPVAWLATEWSWDDSRTVLTLTLRDDVEFTDGTAFDADAAAQNILRFRDGSAPDKAQLALVTDAVAVDATTLQITVSEPDPSLLANLTQAPGLMESPAAFDSPTVDTVPVGSGPYVMNTEETIAGSSYVFDRNEDYWALDTVGFEKLVISVLPSPQAIVNAILGGQVDVTSFYDNTVLAQTEAAGYTSVPTQLNWAGLVLLDREGALTPALGDVRVRQAINYAIDRDAMLQAVGGGYGQVTSSVFSSSSPAYDADLDSYYAYDPDKAIDLLAEAGYPDGFTIEMPRISGFGETADDLIADYLSKVGITVTFTSVSLTDIIAEMLAPKYSALYFELQQDPNAFQAANFLLAPDAVFNPFRVDDPQVVEYIDTIQAGSDAEALEAAKALNEYTVEQAWNAPFYRTDTTLVLSPRVGLVTPAGENNGVAYSYLYNLTPQG